MQAGVDRKLLMAGQSNTLVIELSEIYGGRSRRSYNRAKTGLFD